MLNVYFILRFTQFGRKRKQFRGAAPPAASIIAQPPAPAEEEEEEEDEDDEDGDLSKYQLDSDEVRRHLGFRWR